MKRTTFFRQVCAAIGTQQLPSSQNTVVQTMAWDMESDRITNQSRGHSTHCIDWRVSDAKYLKYNDAASWHERSSASDIKLLLQNHLQRSSAPPSYDALAKLLELKDIESINIILREITAPPPPKAIDVDAYLGNAAVPHLDAAALMTKQEDLGELCKRAERALSVLRGSEKRNIASYSSPQTTRNTQLVKSFVHSKRADAIKCGRVIVRSCKTEADSSWMASVQEERARSLHYTSSPGASERSPIQRGLCELIRSHVESVTDCPQSRSNYAHPQIAYASWISETARCFNIHPEGNVSPLIILDSCEFLSMHDHNSLVHKHSATPYTLLEAFCLAVPSPHSIFVVGCDAKIDTSDPLMLAIANVREV